MRRKFTFLSFLSCLLLTSAFAQFSNVPVTGYNADEVANGIGLPGTTTTGDVDGGTYVFIDGTYQYNSTCTLPPSGIMPATNQLSSLTTSGLTYTLQSYTGNNALRIPAAVAGTGVGAGTGTLTVTTPVTAGTLYLLAVAGGGAISSGINVTINFTDGVNPQTFTNLSLVDWCSGTNPATAQLNRIQISSTTGCSTGSSCQYLYEIQLPLSIANYTRNIASIAITKTTSTNVLNVFAVGRKAPCAFPTAQPTSLTFTAGASQISGSFTAATGAPSNYLVVRYPQGATVTPPVSGTTYTNGQALGLGTVVSNNTTTTFVATGLTPNTSYDFYVYSYNSGTCSGPLYLLTPSALTGTQSTTGCGTLSGTIPVGPGLPNTPAGGFTSLTNALAYINNSGLGGNTTLALQTGYDGTSANETFPITFPTNPCIGSTRTLTIKPATGVTGLVITNTSDAAPLIDFNGATYVTIDGVNNGLTISNTSVAATANTSTIRFINDATKCTVTNCTVLGSAIVPLSTNGGTIYFATGVTNGNDSITISNCKIGPAGSNLPSKGIYSQGSTSSATIANSAINITGNEIYDYFLTTGSAGIYDLTGSTIWNITNNKLYQTGARNFTGNGTMYGIYFSNSSYGTQTQITGNILGSADNAGGGTLTITGTVSGSYQGIYFNMLSSDTNTCNISNNTIANISMTSSSGSFYGIENVSGVGSNTININNNQLSNIATITTTGTMYGIYWSSATNMFIQNNTLNNLSRTGTGTTYGLYSGSSSTNETVTNNILSNFNSTSTGASTFYGIYQNTASGNKIFQNNKISNFTGLGGTSMYGIRIGYGTNIDISNNTISGLNSTGGTSGAVYGIYTGTVGTTYNVYKNKIYNLSVSGTTTASVYGLYNSSSTINAYNNIIGDLSSTAYTSSSSPYIGVSGIYISSGTSNLYNNTVYIGTVTSSGTNFSATGIYASTSPTVLLQNNLVVNLSTPKGSGKAIGYFRSSTTLTTFATASNNNSYYCGTPGTSNVIFWDGTNAYQTLATYQTAVTPREALAVTTNPTFLSTTGSSLTYLHITPGVATPLESGGVIVSLFNTDIDGDARPGPAGSVNGGAQSYDIGADEFDGITSFTCTTPAPGNTISSANNLCNGATVTLSLQNTVPGTGITYKWYNSTDGTNYTVIPTATSSTYTVTPAIATYYKCTVTCGGTLSATSIPVLVTFANNITATTPNFRCGTGTVALSATASSGTLNWYPSLNGGASLGTGTSFTTPSISATTTFYVGAESYAPGTVSIGNATTTTASYTYPTAFGDYWYQDWSQMVYTAAELQAAGLAPGNITSLTFKTAATSSNPPTNYSISLGATTNATLSAFTTTGLTQVYSAATQTNTAGNNTITFTTPYPWDGTSNIIVDLRETGSDASANATTYYTATPGNTVVYAYTTSNNTNYWTSNPTPNVSTNRFNIVFAGNTVCSSPRTPVVATVNAAPALTITPSQTICNNAVTPLSVTSTLSSYNSYVWSPATNLYTNAGATTPYVAGASASTVYLKSSSASAPVYTLSASNSTSLCAQVAQDTVTVLPSAVTATATPAYSCMSGVATLTVAPSTGYGAAQYQWQSSTDNTTFSNVNGATAQTYSTPAITSTKYYRLTVENSAGSICLNSGSDTVRIYTPTITGTTPAAKCGPGVVTLGATGTDGIVNWYSDAAGTTNVGTGNSFTTPSLTTTTTYYAGVQAYSGSSNTIGTGTTVNSTTTYPTPFGNWYGSGHEQFLIPATEMLSAGYTGGTLTSIAFSLSSGYSYAALSNFQIQMANTSATAMTAAFISTGLSTVVSSTTYTPPATAGMAAIPFTAPFIWDGVSSVLVDVSFSNCSVCNGTSSCTTSFTDNGVVNQTPTSYASTYDVHYDNNCTVTSMAPSGTFISSTYNQRPNIQFMEASCQSALTPVVATINTVPTASISPAGPIQICAGNTTTLTGGGGTAYQWRNATGNINGQTNSTFNAGATGSYRVVAITAATGCSDTSAAVSVTVNPVPAVNLGNDTTFCSGNSLVLNAGNAGASYLWNNASTAQTRVASTTGVYAVKVTNNFNCVGRDTINITVNPTPQVNLGIDTFVCTGTSYTLNAQNAGASYLWDNSSTNQTRTVNTSGTYYVKVTNSYNCVGRDTAVVTYLVTPIVNLGNDISACAGDVVTLNAGNPGNSYLWDNGSTQQTRNVTTTGSYHVAVKNAANCVGYDTVVVTVHPLPIVDLGNDTTICHGKILILDAGNPGDTYLWSDNSTGQTLTVSATDNYSVHVKDANNCVGTDNINVFVKPLPSGIINAVHGDTATYTFNVLNPEYVTNYTWNFGDNSPLVIGALVQHRYTQNGQYLVSVMFNGECEDSAVASRTVEVYDVVGGSTGIHQVGNSKALSLYPNPAKDLVVVENLGNLDLEHITVYNVLGQKVYDQAADNRLKHNINISGFISGMYTARIETSGGTVVRKFEVLR